VLVLLAALGGCGSRAAATPAWHGPRFTITTAAGSRVQVPGSRPLVMDFVSVGCDTGLATLAQAKAADPAVDYVAVDIDPGATAMDARAILAAAGTPGLAAATSRGGALTAAYQVQAAGTTVVQAPSGRIIYTGIDPSRSQLISAVIQAARR
jgi:hypothetical protein